MVDSFFKVKTYRDKDHLNFVRSLPCIICYSTETQAHHVRAGGTSLKCSDLETVSLCCKHHLEIHCTGKDTFKIKYDIDLDREVEAILKLKKGKY